MATTEHENPTNQQPAHWIDWYLRSLSMGGGYTVTVYDAEWQPLREFTPDDPCSNVSNLTLIRYALQTAAGFANEHALDAERIRHDRDSEDEDQLTGAQLALDEYAYTDEMPAGQMSYYRRAGFVIYNRDGDIWTILPAECEGLAAAITAWLNEPEPLFCRECGARMFIEQSGVAHHGIPDAIDYDADADHVAIIDLALLGQYPQALLRMR